MNSDRAELVMTVVRMQAVRECLAKLTKSGTAEQVGRKVLLTAFLLDRSIIGRQKDLAERLGVSEPRTSQMLKILRRNFGRK
jgi:DNA-binding MarR family transcriptional regulator